MDATKEYPKVEDVATKDDFKFIRLQLFASIKTCQAHIVSTALKHSSER